ncbi:MAG: hypothetical protein WBW53_06105 [Terriglobales bacterium]
MGEKLHFSVRTIQALLNDLETLGLQHKVGLYGESGPAIRQLDVSAFKTRSAELGAGVQCTQDQECNVHEQECNVHEEECNACTAHNRPSDRPEPKPTNPEPPASQTAQAGWTRQAVACTGRSYIQEQRQERERWLEFINDKDANLPESMRYAEPTEDERHAVLAQLDAIVIDDYARNHGYTKASFLGEAISQWEEQQSPPIRTLMYGRWKRWLETGDPNS